MKRARVVDHKTGGSTVSDARTSTGTHFKRGETATIRAIEERLAAWTLLPVENGEAIQVLQYQEDQQYRPHFDYFLHSQGLENGELHRCPSHTITFVAADRDVGSRGCRATELKSAAPGPMHLSMRFSAPMDRLTLP